jgi:hypothetical protein
MKRVHIEAGLGMALFAVWLIATGIFDLVSVGGTVIGILLDLLALAAGVVMLMRMPGGKLSSKLSALLPGIWLIATGLIGLINLSFTSMGIIMALLAIAAGIAMLFPLRGGTLAGKIGIILAAIWLIVTGVIGLVGLSFTGLGIIMALLAITAGILILLGK